MDKNINAKMAMAENNAIGLDDEFEFACLACGNCCRNREDLLVTPYDIFRIAKYLQMSMKEVIEKYCEVYIGDDSRLPVVRIKPKIHNLVCPFLKKGLCGIQEAKPLICGIYVKKRIMQSNGKNPVVSWLFLHLTLHNS